jgi:hypothetical protein
MSKCGTAWLKSGIGSRWNNHRVSMTGTSKVLPL